VGAMRQPELTNRLYRGDKQEEGILHPQQVKWRTVIGMMLRRGSGELVRESAQLRLSWRERVGDDDISRRCMHVSLTAVCHAAGSSSARAR
jgi:hypothetical protein